MLRSSLDRDYKNEVAYSNDKRNLSMPKRRTKSLIDLGSFLDSYLQEKYEFHYTKSKWKTEYSELMNVGLH